MPLYEYQCEACGNRFERIQKFSDPPVDACPACAGAVRKLLSSPAIQFKGSGWYITDYARKASSDKTKASASDDGSKPDSSSSASSSSSSTTKTGAGEGSGSSASSGESS